MKNQETKSQQRPSMNQSTANNPNLTLNTFTNLNPSFGQDETYIYCKQQKTSQHACMNRNCSSFAFVCQDDDCQCQLDHEGCFITKTSTIIKAIQKRIVSVKPLQDAINQTIDKIIDGLSDFRDKLLLQLQQKFKFCGISNDEIKILTSLNFKMVDNITGRDVSKVNVRPDQKQAIQVGIKKTSQRIQKLVEQMKGMTQSFQRDIKDFQEFQMKKFDQKSEQHLKSSNDCKPPVVVPVSNFNKSTLQNKSIFKQYGIQTQSSNNSTLQNNSSVTQYGKPTSSGSASIYSPTQYNYGTSALTNGSNYVPYISYGTSGQNAANYGSLYRTVGNSTGSIVTTPDAAVYNANKKN